MNQTKIEEQLEEANEVIMDTLMLLEEITGRIEDYVAKFRVSMEDVPDLIPANLLKEES